MKIKCINGFREQHKGFFESRLARGLAQSATPIRHQLLGKYHADTYNRIEYRMKASHFFSSY